jgi:hypothetical protein
VAKITRAISIRQPYVEQILRGEKKYEYHSQDTRIRERVYLYASLTPGSDREWRKIGQEPGNLPTGRIVGTVVGVEKLLPAKFQKIKLRQDALGSLSSRRVDIFYPHNLGCLRRKGSFSTPTVEITGSRRTKIGDYAYKLERPKRLKMPRTAVNQPRPRF